MKYIVKACNKILFFSKFNKKKKILKSNENKQAQDVRNQQTNTFIKSNGEQVKFKVSAHQKKLIMQMNGSYSVIS